MSANLSLILFKVIKVYSLGFIFYDLLLSTFMAMEIDMVTLVYTLSIEGFFVLLKAVQIEIPLWIEAIQDLV
ncbi:hypothetical protein ACT6NV_13240 [Robiginitalea sp. IMCC44478]|uniref:hypothetical protein n=1 Tax=Robiginitalea sp. IMCC44478 TaxID=3459122 RepID=UPI004042EE84